MPKKLNSTNYSHLILIHQNTINSIKFYLKTSELLSQFHYHQESYLPNSLPSSDSYFDVFSLLVKKNRSKKENLYN